MLRSMTSPQGYLDLPPQRRYALRILCADLDALRTQLDEAIESVRWESTSAGMIRRFADEIVADLRTLSFRLRALL